MARHLRVFAAVRPARPFADVPRRTAALLRYAILQTRMFREVRVGVMHYAHLRRLRGSSASGSPARVTGGLVEAVLAAPADGAIWAAVLFLRNVAAVAGRWPPWPTPWCGGSSSGRRASPWAARGS